MGREGSDTTLSQTGCGTEEDRGKIAAQPPETRPRLGADTASARSLIASP